MTSRFGSLKKESPSPLELDARQIARLEARIGDLTDIGFVIQKRAAGYSIISAPALLSASELEPFIHDILLDMTEDGAPIETIEARKDHLAFLNACRGAVKANDKLNLSQMRRLLDDMRRIPNPWACVHGRPTAMRIPLNALTITLDVMDEGSHPSHSQSTGQDRKAKLLCVNLSLPLIHHRWMLTKLQSSESCDRHMSQQFHLASLVVVHWNRQSIRIYCGIN